MKYARLLLFLLLQMAIIYSKTTDTVSQVEVLMYMQQWGKDPFPDDRVEMLEAIEQLQNSGITVKLFSKEHYPNNVLTLKDNQYVVVFDVYDLFEQIDLNNLEEKLYLIAWEPPVVRMDGYNKKIKRIFGDRYYSMSDELVEKGVARKTYFSGLLSYKRSKTVSFQDKKFMVAVYTDKNFPDFKYELGSSLWHEYDLVPSFFSLVDYRRSVISYFSDKGLDLYGSRWDKRKYPCYQGQLPRGAKIKIELIKDYKFVLAIENTGAFPGYTSEKIFDAMIAGSVPIYTDHNNTFKFVPRDCFIDPSNFDSLDDLYYYLSTMTEEHYNEYLAAIKKFLSSDVALLFKIDNFVKFFKDIFLKRK